MKVSQSFSNKKEKVSDFKLEITIITQKFKDQDTSI